MDSLTRQGQKGYPRKDDTAAYLQRRIRRVYELNNFLWKLEEAEWLELVGDRERDSALVLLCCHLQYFEM